MGCQAIPAPLIDGKFAECFGSDWRFEVFSLGVDYLDALVVGSGSYAGLDFAHPHLRLIVGCSPIYIYGS